MARPAFGNHVDSLMEALQRRDAKRPVSIFADPTEQLAIQQQEQQNALQPEDLAKLQQQRDAVKADPIYLSQYKDRLKYDPEAAQPYKQQLQAVTQIGEAATRTEQAKSLWRKLDAENRANAERQNAAYQGIADAQGLTANFASGDYQLPLSKFTITAKYGQTGHMWKTTHGGLDLAAPTGTAIKPTMAGTVTRIENHPAFGNVVWIQHPNGLTTRYGHMSKFGNIHLGQQVGFGDILGYVGQTGNASGPHLHLGFYNQAGQTLNPENYIGYLLKMAGY